MTPIESTLNLAPARLDDGNPAIRHWYPMLFLVFTPLVLMLDSVGFTRAHGETRPWVNGLVLLFFLGFYRVADAPLKKLLLAMVPLSYLGELIFCGILGWYRYRLDDVPMYVPLGHAIVYGAGYVLAQYGPILRAEFAVRRLCCAGFALLFIGVTFGLGDYFSGLSGSLFFWLMRRKKWPNLYFMIALCVVYIEMLGTHFGCWTWSAKIHGVLPTVNPPVGAVFFYACGDALLARIVSPWTRWAQARKA